MADDLMPDLWGSVGLPMRAYWPSDESWVLNSSLHAAQLVHADMIQKTYGDEPSQPLSIVWVQSPNSMTAGIKQDELSDAAIQQYQLLGGRLAEIAQMAEPPVEVGAIASADKVLKALVHHKFQPPEITWHGGDAIVMLWRLGTTSYAITVTDGELGYVVRAERKTLQRKHSMPLDEVRRLVAG